MTSASEFLKWAYVFKLLPNGGGTGSGTVSPGLANEVAWYGVDGNTVQGLPTAANGLLITNALGEPSISNTLTGALYLSGMPMSDTEAVNKAYVDLIASGLVPAGSVQAASTANVPCTYDNGAAGVGATITVTATGVFALDGVDTVLGDPYLFKNQSTASQNGIYECTTEGAPGISAVFTRSTAYDTPAEINATGIVPVVAGTTQTGSGWYQVNVINTVGTDALTYVKFGANGTVTSVTAGTGLTGGVITGAGTISLDVPVPVALGGTGATNAPDARTNLGLGSMSVQASSAVNITGGVASLSVLTSFIKYTELTGDADLAVVDSNQAFIYVNPGVDLSDGLGLASYTNGFTIYLKNLSGGVCSFTPFTGETIDGLTELLLDDQDGYVITKCDDQWSIMADKLGTAGAFLPLAGGTMSGDINMGANDILGLSQLQSGVGVAAVDFSYTPSAVNYFQMVNASNANPEVLFQAIGTSTNVAMGLTAKGGRFNFKDNGTANGASLNLYAANGLNSVGFIAPSTLSGSTQYTLPSTDGSPGYVMSTNGSGVLSWIANGGGGGAFLPLAGGTMSGDIDMDGNNIQDMPLFESSAGAPAFGILYNPGAIDYIAVYNSAGGIGGPGITSIGVSTNVPIGLSTQAADIWVGDKTFTMAAGVRFYDAASLYYTSIRSPATTMANNVNYILPVNYPTTSGDVLSSTTAGVMSWVTPGGGGAFLPLAGGTMSGVIDMDGYQIRELVGIADTTGATVVNFDYIVGAANHLAMSNNTVGNAPFLESRGTDSSVDLGLGTKAGHFNLYDSTGTIGASLRLYDEDRSAYIGFRAPETVTTSISYLLPEAPTVSGYVLSSDTSGDMSWIPAAGGSVTPQDIQDEAFTFAVDSSSTDDVFVITLSPAITSYEEGQQFTFRAASNTTDLGTATLNVNGIGAEAMYAYAAGTPRLLTVGDIISGGTYTVTYSDDVNGWVLMNPSLPALVTPLEVQLNTYIIGTDNGAANAYELTGITPSPTSITQDGTMFMFRAASGNTNTGASTVTINSIVTPFDLQVYSSDDSTTVRDLLPGEIIANNFYLITYSVVTGGFILLNPSSGSDIQNQIYTYWPAGGTTNALSLNPEPPIVSYIDGQRFCMLGLACDDASTIDVSSVGAVDLLDNNFNPIVDGQILTNGIYDIQYSAVNSAWVVLNPSGGAAVFPSDIQEQTFTYGVDTSVTAGEYEIAVTPTITAYTPGMSFTFRAASTFVYSSTDATLDVDGVGAIPIRRAYPGAGVGVNTLSTGDIISGGVYTVVCDASATNWVLMNPTPPEQYSFSVYNSTGVVCAAGAFTLLDWDSEDYDNGNFFDTSSASATIVQRGVYHFDAQAWMLGTNIASNTQYQLSLYINGTQVRYGAFCGVIVGGGCATSLSVDIFCETGDVIEMYMFNGNGGGLAITTNNSQLTTWWTGRLVLPQN